MDNLRKIVHRLEHGVVLSPTDEMYQICAKVTVVFVSLAMHAADVGKDIVVHILDVDENVGVQLACIHDCWVEEMTDTIIATRDKILFRGVAIYPITEDIEIYAMYKHLIEHECTVCKSMYVSDVNRFRCESSHMSRKSIDARSFLPLKELGEYWDRMGRARKMSSVVGAALYLRALPCLPSECNAPAFAKLIAGDNFGITGTELMKALEEASEFTCGWRMIKKHRAVKPTMASRHDVVAAMASLFVENLAREYAERVSDALIGNDMFLAARVLNDVPIVSKKLGFNMDDITEALEALKV